MLSQNTPTPVVEPSLQNGIAEATEFIRTLFRAPAGEFIPLHAPIFEGNEKAYVADCIDSTFVSSVGAYVNRFEEEVAKYTGAAYAVATSNGTSALHIALLLAGVKAGDLVLTQPLTFIATCNAVAYLGAIPAFADVDYATMSLSPDAVDAFLSEACAPGPDGLPRHKATGRTVRAVVPMHTFGFPARLNELLNVCQRHNVTLVEDSAESLGSYYNGQHTGTQGLLGVLSLNGNKTITCGGGGAILTNDEKLAKHAKHLTTQAKVPHRWEFVHDEVGYNYRMPNLNAALACAQLEKLPEFLKRKRVIAKAYADYFAGKPGFEFMTEPAGTQANYWLNTLLLPDLAAREAFLAHTNDNGVMTRPAWRLMHRLPMFSDAPHGPIPVSEELEARLVNIPSSPLAHFA